MMDWLILGKTALFYSIVTIYLGLRPRIMTFFANTHFILQISNAKSFKMKYTRCPYNNIIQKYSKSHKKKRLCVVRIFMHQTFSILDCFGQSGLPRLMQISLLQFFKQIHKFALSEFWVILIISAIFWQK